MKYFTSIVLVFVLFSCGSSKKVTTRKSTSKPKVVQVEKPRDKPSQENHEPQVVTPQEEAPVRVSVSTEDYINMYSAIAQEEMKLYGIPASITLAQGILESSSGKGRLAVEANNHFGIKCHDWTGAKIYHDDDAAQECFRKYNDPKYSYRDHSLFLTKRKRYSKLFTLGKTDYVAWAKELKAAGYATDRKYPDKLISLIERYNLHQYDLKIAPSEPDTAQVAVVPSNSHEVVQGDTLYSISRKYNTTVEVLQELNQLDGVNIKIGQILKISR